MNGNELYRSKLMTAAEAVQAIQSGHRIYLGGGAGVPQMLENAMVARASELKNVEVVHALSFAGGTYLDPAYSASFHQRSLFVGDTDRQAIADGRADFMPI